MTSAAVHRSVRGLVLRLPVLLLFASSIGHAASGTEGAAFLEIPVGGAPAALGSAYSALATNVYAPTWNPAGLGAIDSPQLGGEHIAYLESIHYEYLGYVHPLKKRRGIGFSAQYLGSGSMTGTDNFGNPTGDFSSHYAAYALAYGQSLSDEWIAGLTAKLINAKIGDFSANAYGLDAGVLYRWDEELTFAGTVTNFGTKLNFLNRGDPLPLAFKAGAAYRPTVQWMVALEGAYDATGLASGHAGIEWKPLPLLALRAGYRTDTLRELSALAGLTTGLGLIVWGQELSYAWVPLGDLGASHYFSIVIRFGELDRQRRSMIQFRQIKSRRSVKQRAEEPADDMEYQQLMQLISDQEGELVFRKKPRAQAVDSAPELDLLEEPR